MIHDQIIYKEIALRFFQFGEWVIFAALSEANARVVKLAYTLVLEASAERRRGSSPLSRTMFFEF